MKAKAKKPINAKPEPAKTPPAIVLFGEDEKGKAHASWFSAADAELAIKAAGLMRMRVLQVVTDEQRAIAQQLAVGRIFASGSGFVPFAKRPLYERLSAFEGSFIPPEPVEPVPEPLPAITTVPTRWEDITVGACVLASIGPQEGWFEAIVVEAKGEDLYVLRWRDYPTDPAFARKAECLALLPQNPGLSSLSGADGASPQTTS